MCRPQREGPSGLGVMAGIALVAIMVSGGVNSGQLGGIASALPAIKAPKLGLPKIKPQGQPRPRGRGRAALPARVAYDAGCRGRNLRTAVQVALAESKGRPRARCKDCIPPYKEDSRGLWQVNVNAHPHWRGRDLYDPRVNAAAMWEISGGCRDWQWWSTFKRGDHEQYADEAARAVTA